MRIYSAKYLSFMLMKENVKHNTLVVGFLIIYVVEKVSISSISMIHKTEETAGCDKRQVCKIILTKVFGISKENLETYETKEEGLSRLFQKEKYFPLLAS